MRILWLRSFVGALLYEVVLILMTIPLTLVVPIEQIIPYVPALVLVVGIPFGYWVAKKLSSGFVLHGVLVGIIATILYLGLILGTSGSLTPVIEMYGPVAFFFANALKLVGCAAGAFLQGRRHAPAIGLT
jgi:hypothetical protein